MPTQHLPGGDRTLRLNSESLDADSYTLAGPEKLRRLQTHAHTGGSPRRDHVARPETHELTDVRDQVRNAENHVTRVPILNALVVDFEP